MRISCQLLQLAPSLDERTWRRSGDLVAGSERHAVPQEKEYSVIDMPQPTTASWQKSSATAQECVEVARSHEHVWIRDSKDPLGPVLGLTREEWAVFLVGVQRSEFDRPGVSA